VNRKLEVRPITLSSGSRASEVRISSASPSANHFWSPPSEASVNGNGEGTLGSRHLVCGARSWLQEPTGAQPHSHESERYGYDDRAVPQERGKRLHLVRRPRQGGRSADAPRCQLESPAEYQRDGKPEHERDRDRREDPLGKAKPGREQVRRLKHDEPGGGVDHATRKTFRRLSSASNVSSELTDAPVWRHRSSAAATEPVNESSNALHRRLGQRC
jgi:hypothetical protein